MFGKTEIRAPAGLETHEFRLRPLRASDAQLDFDAVIASREFLRVWEQSDWPADDFTVEGKSEPGSRVFVMGQPASAPARCAGTG